MIKLATTRLDTPLGPVVLLAHDDALVGLEFADRIERCTALTGRLTRHLGTFATATADDPAGAATRLRAYFAGALRALDEQPVEMFGTKFERAVWTQLRRIPVGTTISYAELATRVGRPNGSRAAGQANGRNPVSLFVPCHRVVAADGTLGGYGGGLERKRRLLEHEGALVPTIL
jgi:methylated-DNA-[protein]-cysteine S-methyltransferase